MVDLNHLDLNEANPENHKKDTISLDIKFKYCKLYQVLANIFLKIMRHKIKHRLGDLNQLPSTRTRKCLDQQFQPFDWRSPSYLYY